MSQKPQSHQQDQCAAYKTSLLEHSNDSGETGNKKGRKVFISDPGRQDLSVVVGLSDQQEAWSCREVAKGKGSHEVQYSKALGQPVMS